MNFPMIFLLGLLFSSVIYANETALIVGYQNTTDIALWQEKQIGFGVKNILQQALLDDTDFSLLDEKVILGIGDETLEKQLQDKWQLNDEATAASTLKNLAESYKANHLFWVKIIDFKTKTSKVSFAFVSRSEYEDTLILQVCHYVAATTVTDCQEGQASQSRTLTSVLYKPADQLNFNESGVGHLSQVAIKQSLNRLLHHEE